jgi:hypothetical protein
LLAACLFALDKQQKKWGKKRRKCEKWKEIENKRYDAQKRLLANK